MSEQDAPRRRNPLTRAYMGVDGGLPLEVSQGGIEELRRGLQQMMDIEAVKQLKQCWNT